MSVRIPTGQQRWEGFHVVCRPLELAGVDRRLFGLMLIFFMIFWQGFGALFTGIVATLLLYYVFRWATKYDPQFFAVLRAAARLPGAWYDEARPPLEFGPYITANPGLPRELERRAAAAARRQAPATLSTRLARRLSALLDPGRAARPRRKESH